MPCGVIAALPPSRQRRSEAAAWFARMNRPGVPASDLEAFAAWRRRPGADAAFADISSTWRRSDLLRDHAPTQALVAKALSVRRAQRQVGAAQIATSALPAGAVIAGLATLAFTGPTWTTKPGQRREIALADGSHVLMDADTRLQSRWLSGAPATSGLFAANRCSTWSMTPRTPSSSTQAPQSWWPEARASMCCASEAKRAWSFSAAPWR